LVSGFDPDGGFAFCRQVLRRPAPRIPAERSGPGPEEWDQMLEVIKKSRYTFGRRDDANIPIPNEWSVRCGLFQNKPEFVG
jgi:hypothetical protein